MLSYIILNVLILSHGLLHCQAEDEISTQEYTSTVSIDSTDTENSTFPETSNFPETSSNTQVATEKWVCPKIRSVCRCVAIKNCGTDSDCTGRQMCCTDCCGGTRCMDPMKSEVCTKDNEIHKSCGTSCPPTCENPNPEGCTLQCVKGCFCKPGFLRNKKGLCVLQENCSKSTGV